MARRARGKGSVYRRQDGPWAAQCSDADCRRRCVCGRSQQGPVLKEDEASERLSDLRRPPEKARLLLHRFHDLRHDFATLLLAQGAHLRVVMEALGHPQINLTADTYSHVASSQLEDAARALDEVLTRKKA